MLKTGHFRWGGRMRCARHFADRSERLPTKLTCSRLRSSAMLSRISDCFDEKSPPRKTLNKLKSTPRRVCFLIGWGGRIRTYECSSQSAVSYRLTTPQNIKLNYTNEASAKLPRLQLWGGRWDSNPRSPVPQTGALTN